MSVLEQAIDDLYRLPLNDFTAARNRLAKSLTGSERDVVRALEKPTVIPWTVNQLFWRARPHYERLMKAGAALRSAQIEALEGRAGRVPKTSSTHRQVLAETATRAVALAAEHDVRPPVEPLTRMLEALSLTPSPPEQPGRHTAIVQLSGFEALAGVIPVAAASGALDTPRAREAAGARSASAREPDERQAKRRAEAEQALASAETALSRAKEREGRERGRVAKARQDLAEAEAALDAARGDVQACEAALRTARTVAARV